MVPIKQNLVSSSKYSLKCPYAMIAEGITVHNTANNASAKNEINYMINNNSSTSYHYAIDDIEIIQGIPENRNAFHAGDGNGKGNRKTIGVEICYSTGDKVKFEKAQENAAEFVAYKLKEKGWGTDKVYPHKHWSGKHCPHRTLDEYGWDYFINLVNKYLNGGSGSTTKTTVYNIAITYQTWDDVKNVWLPNVTSDSDYAGIFGHDVCGVYANLSEGDCVYKVHTQGGSWLPEVKNRTDYAGIFNKPIDGFMIKATDLNTQIYYQVHIRGGEWLPYVTGYNTSDNNNGYAGIIGKPIDGIRMYAKKTIVQTIADPSPSQPSVPVLQPEPVKKYYRVRISWADSKSQVGAYTDLQNAIDKCQSAGNGYKVFDDSGKEVYVYKMPTIVEPSPTPVQPEVIPTPPVTTEPEKKEENVEVKPEVESVPETDKKTDIEVSPEINVESEEKVDNNNKINTIVTIIITIMKKLAEIFLCKFKDKGE